MVSSTSLTTVDTTEIFNYQKKRVFIVGKGNYEQYNESFQNGLSNATEGKS